MIVVLHLGAHKTGTSLIQKYMRDRHKIMRRNRIAFLQRSDGNKVIGWGKDKKLSQGLPQLRRSIQRSAWLRRRAYVISHENALGRPFLESENSLYPNAEALAHQIAGGLTDRRKIAIYYIRDQAAFLESYYLQTIHQGDHHLFDDWVKSKLDGSLSWAPLYRGLCKALGKENVLLKNFGDQIRNGQSAYLSDFFGSFMQVDAGRFDNFEYPVLRNPSVGDLGLELALKINPHLKSKIARRNARDFLQQHFSNASFPRPTLLGEERKHVLQSQYLSENQDIIRESERAFDPPHRRG